MLSPGLKLSVGAIGAQGVNLVILIVGARSFAVAEMGLAITAVAIGSVLSDISDFGMTQSALAESAKTNGERSPFAQVVGAKLTVAAILFGCALIVEAFSPVPALMVVLFGVARSLALTAQFALQAESFYGRAGLGIFGDRCIALVMLTVVISITNTSAALVPLLGAYVAGSLVTIVLALLTVRFPLAMLLSGMRHCINNFRRDPGIGIASLTTNLNYFDTVVVGAISGPRAAGLFGLPARIAAPATTVVYSFALAAYPQMAAPDSHRDAFRYARKRIGLTAGLATVGLLLAAAFASILVPTAFGPQYQAGISVFQVSLIGAASLTYTQILVAFLQARGFAPSVAKILLGGTLSGLVFAAAGAFFGGALGAAFGLTIVNSGLACVLGLRTRNLLRREQDRAQLN